MWPLLLVLGTGLTVRLIALAQMAIINPDGILYIQQAKAISAGQWHLLDQSLPYVSLYPFLIAWLQHLVPDWILSGQLISLCFGMGMLLVVYQLLRLFHNPSISYLTTLLFALTPVFVRYSVDVMRDALFWFFFSLSLWLVLLHICRNASTPKPSVLLVASNCTILLAAWSRIEAIVLLPATCLFLVFARSERNFRHMLLFLLPSICLAGIGLGIALESSRNVLALVRIDEVIRKFTESINAYYLLRDELKELADSYGFSLLGNYLQNSYHTIWGAAIAGIIANIMESFFYPYVIFYMVGLKKWCQRTYRMQEYQYVTMVLVCSLILLFVHFTQSWVMTYRFIAILIIPSSVLSGIGIQRIVDILADMLNIGIKKAIVMVAFFIFFVSLWKNIQIFEADKAVYVTIANKIASMDNSENCIIVASKPSPPQTWITFYANRNIDNPCVDRTIIGKEMNSLDEMLMAMRMKGALLFLWEERRWEKSGFGSNPHDFFDNFDLIESWWHLDTGKIMLFRLK